MSLQEHKFKVVLLGEGRVGKTSLLIRYVSQTYMDNRQSTIAASFLEKTVVLPLRHNQHEHPHESTTNTATIQQQQQAHLSIWDTAGQERFHSLGPIYYRDADGAVLVYDITDGESFVRVQSWVKELRKMVGDETDISIIIVGNKMDLESERVVREDEVEAYTRSVGARHYKASAKTGWNVESIFVGLTTRMIEQRQQQQLLSNHNSHGGGGAGGGVMNSSMNALAGGNQKLTILPPGEIPETAKSTSCCSS